VTVRAGTNTLLGLEPGRIDDILPLLARAKAAPALPALWDGRAAERVADVVLAALAAGRETAVTVG
jgi:UDP-N-acetylglucosamine 2-epimerase (non-hydrolysing)